MQHDLKIWPQYFQYHKHRTKRFELRKNDRDYKVNDTLNLREWDPKTEKFTGQYVIVIVSQIGYEMPGLESGYCVMSVYPIVEKYLNTEDPVTDAI